MQMFPDHADLETETLLWRNPSDTDVKHLTDIEWRPNYSAVTTLQRRIEMFETLGRFRAAMKNAQAVRAMNSLSPEIQKDIGWPVSPRIDVQSNLTRLILGSGR